MADRRMTRASASCVLQSQTDLTRNPGSAIQQVALTPSVSSSVKQGDNPYLVRRCEIQGKNVCLTHRSVSSGL